MRSMFAVVSALEGIRQEQMAAVGDQQKWLDVAKRLRDRLGSGNKLADLLEVSRPYMHRVLTGRKPLTGKMIVAVGRVAGIHGG